MSVDITNFSFTSKWDSYYRLLTLTLNGETLILWTLHWYPTALLATSCWANFNYWSSRISTSPWQVSAFQYEFTRVKVVSLLSFVLNKNSFPIVLFVQQSSSYRISSSLWPLVKKWNKLGEGRQVKYRRPKLQMTGFFWRICTYTWFGLKAIIPGGRREQRNFFAFRFLWPLRSAWPNFLVKLRLLRPDI